MDEEGIDGSRGTETFAELVLAIDTWRWAGVPFRVRSGKALGSPRTEITVTFKPPQQVVYLIQCPSAARRSVEELAPRTVVLTTPNGSNCSGRRGYLTGTDYA